MNQTEAIRGDVAQLVRQHEVAGIDEAIHGATFDGTHLVVAAGYRLVRLLPDSGRVVDQLETFPAPGGLAYDGKHFWQRSEERFQQLATRTGFVLRSIAPTLGDVTGFECFEGDLLILHMGGRSLARIETLDATVVSEIATDAPLRGLAWAGGQLWCAAPGELRRIHPASARVLARLALPGDVEICDLAGDAEGRVWCVDGRSRAVRAFARPQGP